MNDQPPDGQLRNWLRAGAPVPLDWTIPEGEPADAVTARKYTHPGLEPDRVVVRLVPRALAAAEDAALDRLGFFTTAPHPPLAHVRRRLPGFAAAVWLNRATASQTALAVLKEIESIARLAREKPGAARAAYEALGERLATAQPELLPAYFEEVARVFLDGGQTAQAAAMFAKARDAERRYPGVIDKTHREEAFFEFAAAGALSGGVLDDYAEELGQTLPPLEAYRLFRRLCVQRTQSGIAPWASMGTQLTRLATAAGLDEDAEAEALLLELLPCGSLARAATGFWKTYRGALIDLAQESTAVRGRLLNLMPMPPRNAGEFADWWLRFLDASGATAALIVPESAVLAEARPRDGAATWLATLTATYPRPRTGESSRPSFLPELLRRMADRLRSEGNPLELFGGRSWGLDLDLVDLALSLGLKVAPPRDRRLALHQWLQRPIVAGLPHLAADPTFGPLLEQAVDEHMVGTHVDTLVRIPGVRPLLERWLDRAGKGMSEGCLLDVNETLDNVEPSASSHSLIELGPGALEQLRCADIAAALQRTLTGGLIDEYGWPALEEARAKLGPGRDGIHIYAAWPNLIISDGAKAFVVGPERVVLEHDLRPPAPRPTGFSSLMYAGGQLLCGWYTQQGWRAYWSGRPGDYFEPANLPSGFGRVYSGLVGASFEMEDGGRTTGGRAVHAGDTRIPPFSHMLTDGSKFWRLSSGNRPHADGGEFQEYDPVSGRSGRSSLPEFLQADAEDEWELVHHLCWLLPLPQRVADSTPCGSVDGLAGWRVRRNRTTLQLEAVGLDGRAFTGGLISGSRPIPHTGRSVDPLALMRFPGDNLLRPVSMQSNMIVVHDPSGRWQLLKAPIGANRLHLTNGSLLLPPPLFWQCLRPRDESGSIALRSISLERAQLLMDCAFDEWNEENKYPRTLELIKQQLPEITAPPLRSAVLGATVYAALLERRRGSSDALRRADPVPIELPRDDGPIVDGELQKVLSSVTTDVAVYAAYGHSNETPATIAQLRTVSDYFAAMLSGRDDEPPKTLPQTSFVWELLVGRIAAVAYLAASPFVDYPQRDALLRFLEFWKDTPFTSAAQHFTVAGMTEPVTTWAGGSRLERHDGHGYFIRILMPYPVRSLTVLECSQNEPRMLADTRPQWHRSPSSSWDSRDRISELIERVRRDGPFPWKPDAAERLAELTGITRPEAALILAGFPNLNLQLHTSLSVAVRELLGLKSTEANAAKQSLQRIPAYQRLELLSACMPMNLEKLWHTLDPSVSQVATRWRELLGARTPVPEELVVAVQSEIGSTEPRGLTPQAALAAFLSPEAEPRLRLDAQCRIEQNGAIERRTTTGQHAFDLSTLRTMTRLLAWMFLYRPVGDPVRCGIPGVVQLIRERLSNPDLLFSGKVLSIARDHNLVEALQAPAYVPPQGAAYSNSRDLGWAVILSRYQTLMNTYLRPARVTGDESADMVALFGFESLVRLVRFAVGDGAASMARRVEHTPVPPGGFEADPVLSNPTLVEEVSDELKLNQSAARLYLQLLTLSEPTMRNVLRWNGWSAAEYRAAAMELVTSELVVTGKRSRAGREIFLPGAWLRTRPPDLPMETWKLPLYDETGLDGRYVPMRAVHELFATAWERTNEGDAPRGGE